MAKCRRGLFLACISTLFFMGLAYSSEGTIGPRFKLLGVEVDVISHSHSPGYLGRKEAAALVEKEIRVQLDELELLAKAGEKSRPLFIRVDLERKFGQGSSDKRAKSLYETKISFDLRSAAKGEGQVYERPGLWLSRRKQVNAQQADNGADAKEDLIRLQEGASLVVANVHKLVGELKPEERVVYNMIMATRQTGIVERELERLAKARLKPQPNIVPPAVIKEYFEQLKQKKGKQRLALYKDLVTKTWFVSPQFFDQLKVRLDFQVSKKQGKPDEVAWGIKALASSGDPKYHDAISGYANSGADRKIVRHARKALALLSERKALQDVIQIDAPDTRSLDWRKRQQLNLLRSGVTQYQLMAVNPILRFYLDDPKVTDAVAKELRWSAERSNMRNTDAERYRGKRPIDEFQILASQILARTKLRRYRPILLRLEKNSLNKSVRKAAKSNAKRLK